MIVSSSREYEYFDRQRGVYRTRKRRRRRENMYFGNYEVSMISLSDYHNEKNRRRRFCSRRSFGDVELDRY